MVGQPGAVARSQPTMKTTKVIEIDGDRYALAANISDTELVQLITILTKGGLQKVSQEYYSDRDSRYAVNVLVKEKEASDVKVGVTCSEIVDRTEYYRRREEGEAVYVKAHPETDQKAA